MSRGRGRLETTLLMALAALAAPTWRAAATSLCLLPLAGLVLAAPADPPQSGASPQAPAKPPARRTAGAAPADPRYGRAAAAATAALTSKHGAAEAERIRKGVSQVVRAWRSSDGDPKALQAFLEAEFLPRGEALDAAFGRFEFAFERIGGYLGSLGRDLRRGVDLDLGPMTSLDERLATYDPFAHVTEDMFTTRVAFTVLLNFPVTTLEERLRDGLGWSRRQWAEARLAQQFAARVPAEVSQRITVATAEAETYLNDYNIYMHHVLAKDGSRPFPEGLRLITHWGLRDELKARYADPDGLPRQRLIQAVMERIVRQEIPAAVIDNPLLDWTPETNAVAVSKVADVEAPAGAAATPRSDREPDNRYARWIDVQRALKRADPYYPDDRTYIDRSFNLQREIPEQEVKALFESVLKAPVGARVARIIEARLGRGLEPFDLWYAGFKPRGRHGEAELDALTRARYPSVASFAADIPRILRDLGFAAPTAAFVAAHIEVEPSRGPGHALGAQRRDDKAHLRTRVGQDGMDYKGYNIAVHELGHNVEQVFSMTTIDHTLLNGVPNNAFTEALAFVFQAQDLRLLGLGAADPDAASTKALEDFWATREIAGVGLVDIAAWRWLYAHPQATPAEFREAVLAIARGVWNTHYAPLLGGRDTTLLAIYSHMVMFPLYVPDYPLGHLIAFQVEDHFGKTKDLGAEFERMTKIGSITPDAWMRQAVGGPLSAAPLVEAAERAVAAASASRSGPAPGDGGGGGAPRNGLSAE